MATRYCIHGATNNGDGTTSAEASTPGGTGAYNNFRSCLLNSASYTVAAGDTCYVKSSPAGAGGGDVTVSVTTTTTIAAGSGTAPTGIRRFVIDDGSVWAQSGSLIIKGNNASYDIILMNNYVSIEAAEDKFVLDSDYTGTSNNAYIKLNNTKSCWIDGLLIKHGTGHGASGFCRYWAIESTSYAMKFGKVKIETHAKYQSGYMLFFIDGAHFEFEQLIIDFKVASAWILAEKSTGTGRPSVFIARSGAFTGVTLDTQRLFLNYHGINAYFYNFVVPHKEILKYNVTTIQPACINAQLTGNDKFDFIYDDGFCYTDWDHNDGNYPTGNATLPDSSNTPWSVYVNPYNTSVINPGLMLFTSKLWTDSADQVKLTFEFLFRNTWTNLSKETVWIEVMYTDNTSGDQVTESTQDRSVSPASLATGSGISLWSSLTYGAQTMTSYKIEHTTTGDVKQNTLITVRGHITQDRPDSSSNGFADPDIALEAV